MKILFVHPNFPAQFRHMATALAKTPNHEMVFGTMRQDGNLSGVSNAYYQSNRQAGADTHRYVRSLENAVLQGQAFYRMAQELKADGFYPHMVYAHLGWGPRGFVKDIFPKAKHVGYKASTGYSQISFLRKTSLLRSRRFWIVLTGQHPCALKPEKPFRPDLIWLNAYLRNSRTSVLND